ncbi:hypothetical protein FN846DRAFT_927074 [Sphaerosporella brunnea]|uniref:Uncharacterized protein n=1 Tax=Sphaerosporella brunnea TaxID=1250544 RepID=A0A5J5FAP8_9PEZI|nr:hypothetical protein FN846DRAFT_927074 [Sphaerosporella brunnea]
MLQLILLSAAISLVAAFPTTTTPPTYGTPTKSPCPSICADYVNSCGMPYGGCFPDPKCTGGTAWPTFSPPPCPTTSSCTSSAPACTQSICYDYVNECGQMYGGCLLAPKCGGPKSPTFSKPPCTVKPTYTTAPTPKPKCTQKICYDMVNECGMKYGGCILTPECGGPKKPDFPKPVCPVTEGKVYNKTVTKTVTKTEVAKEKCECTAKGY